MRLLLVGDSHGNDRYFARMCAYAKEQNCTALVQLGDFGYWEHYPEGAGFLKWCSRQLREKNLVGYFLDGNHENHPMLWSTYGPGGPRHQQDGEGFWEIRQSLYYIPRGHRWAWDGVSFLAVGGAHSIDREYRTPGKSWWPTETIRTEDVEKASAGGKVDVLLAHDCPWGVTIPSLKQFKREIFPESQYNRELLREVFEATLPYFVAHGHFHDRYSDRLTIPVGTSEDGKQVLWHSAQVEGLGADMSPPHEAALVFDTAAFNDARPNG